MIQNHTDIKALRLCHAFDLSTNAEHPFQNASSLKARLVNDNGQHMYTIYSPQDLENQPSWSIVLADPAAVLQCLRVDFGGSI